MEKAPLSIVEYQTIVTCGNVKYYNETLDKIKPTNEKHIPIVFEDVISSSTSSDPYLSNMYK